MEQQEIKTKQIKWLVFRESEDSKAMEYIEDLSENELKTIETAIKYDGTAYVRNDDTSYRIDQDYETKDLIITKL